MLRQHNGAAHSPILRRTCQRAACAQGVGAERRLTLTDLGRGVVAMAVGGTALAGIVGLGPEAPSAAARRSSTSVRAAPPRSISTCTGICTGEQRE